MENTEIRETGCCKIFNPDLWQGKTKVFNDKLFLKDHVTSLFHIPLNYDKVMTRDAAMIEYAGAHAEGLVLNDENSLWGSDVYVAVDREVPGAEMEKISGEFLTRVYEGPYRDMGKHIDEMQAYVTGKGREMEKLYFYYTYCPECAKAYGKNYTVLLAKVA